MSSAPRPARDWFGIAFVMLLVANLLPLTAEYLPFSDLSGHMGVAADLARWNDPAARIPQLFQKNPHPIYHSMLFESLGAVAGRVLPITLYTNLFLAVFYIAATPLSLLLLLRAYGRDARLSLLIFPFLYVVAVWMGFVNYLASMPLVLLSLALLRRMLDAPTLRNNLLLALSVTTLVLAHFFGALVFFGLGALLLLVEVPRPLVLLRVLLTCVPGWLLLRSWKAGGAFSYKSALRELLRGPRDYAALAKHFYHWTLGGLMDGRSDWILGAMMLSLLAAVIWGLWYRRRADDEGRRALRVRIQPLVLFVVTLVMMFRLPGSVPGWWAVNVRLIPLVAAFAILAIPEVRRPPPALLLGPAMVAGASWGLYLTWDFHRHFNHVEMAGFDETLDAIPKGKTVLALWPPRETDTHYMQFPFPYMGMLYVARRGGMATPLINGPDCDEPLWPRVLPPSPVWGQAHQFSFSEHGPGWQYFLIKQPPPGFQRNAPFVRAPPGSVRLIAEHGRWSAYENLVKP